MEPTTVVVPPGAVVIVETEGAPLPASDTYAVVAQLVRELDPQRIRAAVAEKATTLASDPYAATLGVVAEAIEAAR